MTEFNAELYRINHEDEAMNAMEKIVAGFLIGLTTAVVAFVLFGLAIQAAVMWP